MNKQDKNILKELPPSVKFKIEVEAEKETSKVMDGIFTIEKRVDQIMYLRDAYRKLLESTKADMWFKESEHFLEVNTLLEVIQRNAVK